MSETMKKLYDQGILTDTIIRTASRDFPCHSVVLVLSSQYFYDIFKNRENWNDILPRYRDSTIKIETFNASIANLIEEIKFYDLIEEKELNDNKRKSEEKAGNSWKKSFSSWKKLFSSWKTFFSSWKKEETDNMAKMNAEFRENKECITRMCQFLVNTFRSVMYVEYVIDWKEVSDEDTVSQLLHFIYNDRMISDDNNSGVRLFALACHCRMKILKEICAETIFQRFVRQPANFDETEKLFLLKHNEIVTRSTAWLTLNYETRNKYVAKILHIKKESLPDNLLHQYTSMRDCDTPFEISNNFNFTLNLNMYEKLNEFQVQIPVIGICQETHPWIFKIEIIRMNYIYFIVQGQQTHYTRKYEKTSFRLDIISTNDQILQSYYVYTKEPDNNVLSLCQLCVELDSDELLLGLQNLTFSVTVVQIQPEKQNSYEVFFKSNLLSDGEWYFLPCHTCILASKTNYILKWVMFVNDKINEIENDLKKGILNFQSESGSYKDLMKSLIQTRKNIVKNEQILRKFKKYSTLFGNRFTPGAVEDLLYFIYANKKPLGIRNNCYQLLKAAKLLKLSDLNTICLDYVDDVINELKYSNDDILRELLIDCLSDYTNEIVALPAWIHLGEREKGIYLKDCLKKSPQKHQDIRTELF